jgi:hypothetical protein
MDDESTRQTVAIIGEEIVPLQPGFTGVALAALSADEAFRAYAEIQKLLPWASPEVQAARNAWLDVAPPEVHAALDRHGRAVLA